MWVIYKKNITDQMAIMIRVAELMPDVSDFCENLLDFSIFLDSLPRILGGFTWRLQKEPPISNSKIQTYMTDCSKFQS